MLYEDRYLNETQRSTSRCATASSRCSPSAKCNRVSPDQGWKRESECSGSFVGVRIPAYSGSARKTLLSTPRFVLFDLGIRHASSGARPGVDVVRADPGRYFDRLPDAHC